MVLYAGWVMVMNRRGRSIEEALARLRQGPWFWLIVTGFGLMVMGLTYIAMTSGSGPDTIYRPPVYEDGKIKSSDFDKRPQ